MSSGKIARLQLRWNWANVRTGSPFLSLTKVGPASTLPSNSQNAGGTHCTGPVPCVDWRRNLVRWVLRILLIISVVSALLMLAWGRRSIPANRYRIYKVAEDAMGGGDSAISPDGRYVLTSLRRHGNWDLWVYDLATK